MRILTLDNKVVEWRPHLQKQNEEREKSDNHLRCRDLLKQLFPTTVILEEITIPLLKNEWAFLDFYLPLSKIAIEVHGGQHYEFSLQFHKNVVDLNKQKIKDRKKVSWCNLNNIQIIELPHFETVEEWKKRIPHKAAYKK